MRHASLGEGLAVSAVGLGCMGLATPAGRDERAATTVARALDLGITLFDTADYYGQGSGEETLGRLLGRRRDRAVVATKTGIVHRDAGPPVLDGRPDAVRRSCEESLKRLGTDHIDLYYLARVDPAVPVEDSMGAMAELVAEGKVRHVGLCEAAPATLERAHKVQRLTALQTEYSLWERHVERDILPACRRLGIGLVAYRPLGLGMLTGEPVDLDALPPYDWRHRDPRHQGDALTLNREPAARFGALAAEMGYGAAELALAWLLSRDGDIAVIPGTLDPAHLERDAAAATLPVTAAELDRVEELFPPGRTAGDRYPPPLMKMIDLG
ncbi:aldo/keto reductase [Sphaerisporangium perillae]|uniref:aldo/keto reductase n=1 Tax=Sphaerisporangium perillae TaxID=2935860 RepID=UPI00200D5CD0|nr:aldo/keto reductase [Sphaerisporangium perillae]